jgi:predicted DNA-binding protein (MmcQ/YjbR family)
LSQSPAIFATLCLKDRGIPVRASMNVDEIRKYCLAFPGATETLQWGDALCFKISGKMFAVLGLDDFRLSFKSDPETFAELIEHPDIRPSPYLGRYKWVQLDRLDAVPWSELRDLIRQSHDAVSVKNNRKRSGSPRKKRTKKPAYKKSGPES